MSSDGSNLSRFEANTDPRCALRRPLCLAAMVLSAVDNRWSVPQFQGI